MAGAGAISVSPLLEQALLVSAAAIGLLAVVTLYRIVRGPTMHDRILATNVVGSDAVVILVLLTAAFEEPTFLDIALVYGLLNFLVSVAVSKFTVERGGVL